MAGRNPVIVDGLRSPGMGVSHDKETVSPNSPRAVAGSEAKSGVKRYESDSANFRLMLVDEPNRVVDNVVVPGRKMSAQFSDGKYETADPERQRLIEASNAFKTKKVWDADVLAKAAEKAAEENALRVVEQNPALVAKLRERLSLKDGGVDSFKLPEPVAQT